MTAALGGAVKQDPAAVAAAPPLSAGAVPGGPGVAPAPGIPTVTSAPLPRAGRLCLVVHDDLELRLRLASLIRRAIGTLDADSLGKAAFDNLPGEQLRPYLAVMLILEFMQKGAGADPLDAVARVRARAPGIPVFVFARHGDERTAARAMKAGATDYWPIHAVDVNELAAALKPLVEAPAAAIVPPTASPAGAAAPAEASRPGSAPSASAAATTASTTAASMTAASATAASTTAASMTAASAAAASTAAASAAAASAVAASPAAGSTAAAPMVAASPAVPPPAASPPPGARAAEPAPRARTPPATAASASLNAAALTPSKSAVPAMSEASSHADVAGYRLLKKIAHSASATVYLARNSDLAQLVALKLQPLHGTSVSEEDQRRFARECELLSSLNHRSIADVIDFGITSEYLYLALEYFPCGSMRERLKNPVSERDAFNYARQIAGALKVVHGAGIVHRDLKPSNLMLTTDNRVVLIDFGSARAHLVGHELSRSDLMTGTPYYVCPEQIDGRDPDQRGDLYSLGIILYEMLAGHLPFLGNNLTEIFEGHRRGPVPQLPAPLAAHQPLIDRLLAKNPDDRFPTAQHFLDALTAAVGAAPRLNSHAADGAAARRGPPA
jgi:DNA-binding NarL/FixJ family response regulator